ncbi:MAG: hypothetical protein KIY12_05235 [Thermoplasmata archaeon]|uniref:Uncharacterized protein n=1 Tax=Candidatus Sysuiplasma superficiale TaxID=2823368 RepID=A0A8J8CDZ6_9ARCH|nr:hypothetical protein [Candidatus Sysuiplasma superficiale]
MVEIGFANLTIYRILYIVLMNTTWKRGEIYGIHESGCAYGCNNEKYVTRMPWVISGMDIAGQLYRDLPGKDAGRNGKK